jgi:hypothetical protein
MRITISPGRRFSIVENMMFSLLENPLALNEDRFCGLHGNKLDLVDNGTVLNMGDLTTSISWFENSSFSI